MKIPAKHEIFFYSFSTKDSENICPEYQLRPRIFIKRKGVNQAAADILQTRLFEVFNVSSWNGKKIVIKMVGGGRKWML